LQVELFEGRDAEVVAGEGELQLGAAVFEDFDTDIVRGGVGAALVIDEVEGVASGGGESGGEAETGAVGRGGSEGDLVVVGRAEGGAGDGFIEGEVVGEMRADDGGDAAGVFDAAIGKAGVIGIVEGSVGAEEGGAIEDGECERAGAVVVVLDVIRGVGGDGGEGESEHRVGETAVHRGALGLGADGVVDKGGGGRDGRGGEADGDDDGGVAFDFGVAGGDFEAVGERGGGSARRGGAVGADDEERKAKSGQHGDDVSGEQAAGVAAGEAIPVGGVGVAEGVVDDAALEEMESAAGRGELFDGGLEGGVGLGVKMADIAGGVAERDAVTPKEPHRGRGGGDEDDKERGSGVGRDGGRTELDEPERGGGEGDAGPEERAVAVKAEGTEIAGDATENVAEAEIDLRRWRSERHGAGGSARGRGAAGEKDRGEALEGEEGDGEPEEPAPELLLGLGGGGGERRRRRRGGTACGRAAERDAELFPGVVGERFGLALGGGDVQGNAARSSCPEVVDTRGGRKRDGGGGADFGDSGLGGAAGGAFGERLEPGDEFGGEDPLAGGRGPAAGPDDQATAADGDFEDGGRFVVEAGDDGGAGVGGESDGVCVPKTDTHEVAVERIGEGREERVLEVKLAEEGVGAGWREGSPIGFAGEGGGGGEEFVAGEKDESEGAGFETGADLGEAGGVQGVRDDDERRCVGGGKSIGENRDGITPAGDGALEVETGVLRIVVGVVGEVGDWQFARGGAEQEELVVERLLIAFEVEAEGGRGVGWKRKKADLGGAGEERERLGIGKGVSRGGVAPDEAEVCGGVERAGNSDTRGGAFGIEVGPAEPVEAGVAEDGRRDLTEDDLGVGGPGELGEAGDAGAGGEVGDENEFATGGIGAGGFGHVLPTGEGGFGGAIERRGAPAGLTGVEDGTDEGGAVFGGRGKPLGGADKFGDAIAGREEREDVGGVELGGEREDAGFGGLPGAGALHAGAFVDDGDDVARDGGDGERR